jgi:hypothetical protein
MSRHPSISLKPVRPRPAAAAASLLGVVCLIGSTAAAAQTSTMSRNPSPAASTTAPIVHHHHHRHPMAAKMAVEHHETLEERISTLHAKLDITPAEESDWAPVAQAMRDNDANMQKLMMARRGAAGHDQTAVEAMRTYERFTQAHVDGLKTLISSFETLYSAMPAQQQAVADQVFKTFGHHEHAMKS